MCVPTAHQLLSALNQQGVKLWVDDERIHFRAPRGSLSPEDLKNLRTVELEMIELLKHSHSQGETRLQPRSEDSEIPLTDFQRLFWNSIIKKEGTPLSARVSGKAERISGPLDTCLLNRSIKAVVQRHESLRTRIVSIDGVPQQHIDIAVDENLEIIDISPLSPTHRDAEAAQIARELMMRKIDLSIGPLFEAKLIRLSAQEHVLVLALDHMITDGISNQILSRDTWHLYKRGAQGLPSLLPKLPVRFSDYAAWQQRTRRAWLEEHDSYWKKYLADAPRTRMPINDGHPSANSTNGAIRELSFGRELSSRLRELARRERTLLALVVLSVYVSVMFRWCNQRDLIVPLLENGRDRPELANIVGFLSQLLLLRIKAIPGENFRNLLVRISDEFYCASNHRDCTRTSFIEEFIADRRTELHFNWLPAHWTRWSVPEPDVNAEITIRPFPVALRIPLGKFTPYFVDTTREIRVPVVYRPDLVEPSTLDLFEDHLRMVAEEFARNPLGDTRVVWAKARGTPAARMPACNRE